MPDKASEFNHLSIALTIGVASLIIVSLKYLSGRR